jgi:hypothetical protein
MLAIHDDLGDGMRILPIDREELPPRTQISRIDFMESAQRPFR